MDEKNLYKLHKVLLVIMDEIDRICCRNQIEYTLTGGSMIGAVRHKGFIPWDDDMDVAMTRENYELFKDVCTKELGEDFFFQEIANDKDYPYGFGKLVLRGTVCIAKGHETEAWQKGIYVDIFPLDSVPENIYNKKKHMFINLLLIKLIEGKTGRNIAQYGFVKGFIFNVLDAFGSFFSYDFLRKALLKNMVCHHDIKTKDICNLGGYYGYKRETAKRSCFENFIRVPFEDREYNIISAYDEYLTGVYGDYMQLPPVEKRRTHGLAKLDFGKYENIE